MCPSKWLLLAVTFVSFYSLSFAEDQGLKGDDLDAEVEVEPTEIVEVDDTDDDDDDGGESLPFQSSPDAEISILFTKPFMTAEDHIELPAGKTVELIVGIHNKGDKDFSLTSIEGSLRYPMDYTFYMQNFSTLVLDEYIVPPDHHGSVFYTFAPSDTFGSRSFGLVIALSYVNEDGVEFLGSVFNKTIPIIEVDDGLDGETFFLYLFLFGLVVLIVILAQQFFFWGKRKAGRSGVSSLGTSAAKSFIARHARGTQSVEMGTKSISDDEVDYDWLPKETVRSIKNEKKSKPSKKKRSKKPGTGVAKDGSLSN